MSKRNNTNSFSNEKQFHKVSKNINELKMHGLRNSLKMKLSELYIKKHYTANCQLACTLFK